VRARGKCPVLVMSGGSRTVDLLPVASAMGAVIVVKPFLPDELAKVVARCLEA
jgi:hypothetical protein